MPRSGERARRRGAAAAIAALLLAGCSGGLSPEPDPVPVPVPASAAELIGLWRADFTTAGIADAWFRLGADGGALWAECPLGFVSAAFGEGAFIARIAGWSGQCDAVQQQEFEAMGTELARLTAYRAEPGEAWALLDSAGSVLVRLSPAVDPSLPPGARESMLDAERLLVPPVLDDEARRRLEPPAELPAHLEAATLESVQGSWIPAEGLSTGNAAAVAFAGNDYSGSDGCNGFSGGFALTAGGALHATSGPSTLIGCDNVDIGAWLSAAGRLGLDGAQLVITDREGAELGRLTRGEPPVGWPSE